VARACALALERDEVDSAVVNVGSGESVTVKGVAARLARLLDSESLTPEVTGEYRVGDIRHCFADISRARAILGYEPEVSLEEGMAELAGWLEGQAADDRVDQARQELSRRGLTV
jgi:dTDP-L-rhamnose 4-epimerase